MSQSFTTVDAALADATARLAAISDTPKLDAEILLARALGVSRGHLLTYPERQLDERSAGAFAQALERRSKGEPVAYITGVREFWSLELAVSRDTLVPRPETETLVEQALKLIPRGEPRRVLDLGTGCGAIAIAIASERPRSDVVATDSSAAALGVARANASRHGIANVRFAEGDWTGPVGADRFDVIVSNPPYVRDDDPALDALCEEPRAALAAGPDGLDAIRRIAREAAAIIHAGGHLLVEHGSDQEMQVAAILAGCGWTGIRSVSDLAGRPRVTTATMPASPDKDLP